MKIGVERSLTNVQQYLQSNNHEVTVMEDPKSDTKRMQKKLDAIVVSGLDSNFLGMHDTLTQTPVVSASGKTAEEIYDEIQSRLQ